MRTHLRTLGEPDLSGGQQHVQLQQKRIALLTYLAVAAPRGFHRRDSLVALLWPEHDTEHARGSLRQALYALRQALGDAAVVTRGEEIGLASDRFDCDVWSFERAVERGDAAGAVALYGGDFLAGFYVGGAPAFEKWVEAERSRLDQLYTSTLERLAERTSAQDAKQGLHYWRMLAQHDPFSSRVALRLMHALAAAGDAPAAIRHAEQHAAVLREELDAEPDPDVRALAEQLRRTPPPGHALAAAVPAPPPLVPPPPAYAPIEPAPGRWRRRTRRVLAGAALVLLFGAAAGWWLAARPRGEVPLPVAVLPFTNLSGKPQNDYLAAGLTDIVIAHLGIIRDLRVITTRVHGRFIDPDRPADQVARSLGASQLVDGSVQLADGRLRVAVRLVDARSRAVLLARTYDGVVGDLFAIEAEVAGDITEALRLRLPAELRERLARPPSRSVRAYEHYLRGVYKLNAWNEKDIDGAIASLETAVRTDPTFAAARAALANAYNEKADLFDPRSELREKAYVNTETALLLDPQLADAYVARGNVLWTSQNGFPHEAALREFLRAAELQPSMGAAHDRLALLYVHMGLLDLALEEARAGAALNPLDHWARFRIALVLCALQRHGDAARELATLPGYVAPMLRGPLLGEALLHLGRGDEALRMLDALHDSFPAEPWVQATRALVHASRGDARRADTDIAQAARNLHLLSHAHHAEFAIGSAHALLHRPQQATTWLKRAAEGGWPCHACYANDAFLAGLRSYPPFQQLLLQLEAQHREYSRKYAAPSPIRQAATPLHTSS